MSLVTSVPALALKALFGRRMAPSSSARWARYFRTSAKVAAEFLCLSSGRLIDGLAALQTGLSTGSRQIVPAAEGFHGVF